MERASVTLLAKRGNCFQLLWISRLSISLRFQVSELTAGERLIETLNTFWQDFRTEPSFTSLDSAKAWLFDHLAEYRPFRELMKLCRGTAISFMSSASGLFPDKVAGEIFAVRRRAFGYGCVGSKRGECPFPCPRTHALSAAYRGSCLLNPECSHSHEKDGLVLGEVFLTGGHASCPHCGSMVYELYNDRRCGALFFRGYILEEQFQRRGRTYLWRLPGKWMDKGLKEIHLYIPPKGYIPPKTTGKHKTTPCYLDVRNGFLHIGGDDYKISTGHEKNILLLGL